MSKPKLKMTSVVVQCCLTAALGSGILTGAAQAQTVTENLTFDLSGFLDISAGSNIPPPITEIKGSITVTFDPTLTYDNDTTDIVVNSLTATTAAGTSNYVAGSPLGFTYQNNFLEFGGTQTDSDLVAANTNDLVVAFNLTDLKNPSFPSCATPGYTCGQYTGNAAVDAAGYTLAGYSTGWFYGAPQSSVTTAPPPPPVITPPPPPVVTPPPPVSAVPEPSTYASLLVGLLFLCGIHSARRRSASPLA